MDENKEKELKHQAFEFIEALREIIRPRNQSDRTTFRRLSEFLTDGIKSGKYTEAIFGLVLEFAKEAAGPTSRNPAAVFVTILKGEIGYGKQEKN